MLSYLIERSYGIRTFLRFFKKHRKIWLINLLLVDLFLAVAPASAFVCFGVLMGTMMKSSAITNLIALPLVYLLLVGFFWSALVSDRQSKGEPPLQT